MPKRYSSVQILKFLQKFGFEQVSQKGSHLKFKNVDNRVTIVPVRKKVLPPGTVGGILEKAGLSKNDLDDFFGK
ncbi:MAG: type II toxin-antitoxin system HicA family toxin [Candidatus Peregrinibacteria bacterium]|nr:type II toxin-antitoxin system HicA family toxin [Candidatus Peregrinibacteria bacterium]